jgi:hypothetical protein
VKPDPDSQPPIHPDLWQALLSAFAFFIALAAVIGGWWLVLSAVMRIGG